MDPVARAVELLPGWIGYAGPALQLLLVVVYTSVGLRITAWLLLRPLRKSRAQASEAQEPLHWTEEARHGFAARTSFIVALFLSAMTLAAASWFWTGPLARISVWPLAALSALVTSVVGVEVYRTKVLPVVLQRQVSLGDHYSSVLVMLLILRPALLIFLGVIPFAPARLLSWQSGVWLVCVSAVVISTHFGSALRLGRLVGIVKAPPERLRKLVDDVADQQGLARPEVFLLRWGMSNAVAFPLAQTLGFSDTALAAHSDKELRAICAHELGHLAESTRVRWMRVVGSLVILLLSFGPTVFADYGLVPVVGLVVGALLISVLLRRLSLRMEEHADAHGHDHDPGGYAQALESLYRFNAIPAVMSAKTSHPHLYDRMLASGYQPTYARPPAPSRRGTLVVAGLYLPAAIVAVLGAAFAQQWLWTNSDEVLVAHSQLAVGTHSGGIPLANLAALRVYESRYDEGWRLFDAAESLAGDELASVVAMRAISLASIDRCQEAAIQMARFGGKSAVDTSKAEPGLVGQAADELIKCWSATAGEEARPESMPMSD